VGNFIPSILGILSSALTVEVGSHSELIKKQGYYFELYKLQAEKYGIE